MDRQRVLTILGKAALERAENPLNWPQNRKMSHHGDEVWRLKLETFGDTKPPRDNLCDMCWTIDFEYLFENKLVDNKDEVPLGYLDDIMAKDHCAFCRLVVWSIRQFTPLDPLPIEINGDRIKVDIRNIQLGGAQIFSSGRWVRHLWVVVIPELPAKFCLHSNAAKLDEGLAIRPLDSPVPWSMFDIPSSIHMIRIQSFPKPSSPSPEEAFGRGRRIKKHMDVALLKMWLKICESFHLKEYPDFAVSPKIDSLEVIDVYSKCIVAVPISARYIALSYIWGVNPFYTAVNENWISLQEVGAIDVNDKRFPTTVRDAMQVTKGLGERYLWVDSLCIIQNNPNHMGRLIPVMDQVYAGAILTIVAAVGADAHYGLPGVSRPRDQVQHVEHVQGLQLANALPSTFKIIEASTWNTRAWTYQERILSQRLLVFTEQQCHFNCIHSNYCEELVLEDYDDQGVVFKETDTWVSLDNEPDSHRFYKVGFSNFGAYSEAVQNFTTRNITYGDDTLNAFSGIMSSLERCFRGPFVYGLPATMFTAALLWMPNRFLTRRRDKNSRPLFPSWCWASWDGEVHYHIRGLFDRRASSRVLWKDFKTDTWFSDEESNPASLWKTTPNWDTGGVGIGYFIDRREKSDLMFDIPVDHGSRASRVQRTKLDSGILNLWTHVTTFTVAPVRSQKYQDLCRELVHHYTIHDDDGNDIGILFFDAGPPHLPDMMPQTTLALLSRRFNVCNDCQLHGDLICADSTTPFDMRQFKADWVELNGTPAQETVEQSTDAALTSMYHVMAIEEIGDIHERVGIGAVHMKAFHESKPVRKHIHLG